MTSIQHTTALAFLMISLALMFLTPSLASAQELSIKTTSNDFYRLKAKVEYLTAWVEALRSGERTPPPTFVTILDGDTVSLVGTVVGPAKSSGGDGFAICSSESKGLIGWGDGTASSIVGLSCDGGVSTFELKHTYEESGSYVLFVRDQLDRVTTHVLAVVVGS